MGPGWGQDQGNISHLSSILKTGGLYDDQLERRHKTWTWLPTTASAALTMPLNMDITGSAFIANICVFLENL